MGISLKKKIVNDDDLTREVVNYEPTQRITFEILRKSKKELVEIQLISFYGFLANNEKLTRAFPRLNEPQADLMLREYENGDYAGLDNDFRQKIISMNLEVENEDDEHVNRTLLGKPEAQWVTTDAELIQLLNKQNTGAVRNQKPHDHDLGQQAECRFPVGFTALWVAHRLSPFLRLLLTADTEYEVTSLPSLGLRMSIKAKTYAKLKARQIGH